MIQRCLFLAWCFILFCPPARCASNYMYLVAQYDWTSARGFFLDLESVAPDGTPGTLAQVRMVLGTGDGQQWRYIFSPQGWQWDRDYTARVVITPGSAELWLDGALHGRSTGVFQPYPVNLSGNYVPYWAKGPTDYTPVVKTITGISSSGAALDWSFDEEASRPLPLWLFAGEAARHAPWPFRSGEIHTFSVTFRFMRTPNPRDYDPHIDRFGQSRHGEWPGKVSSEDGLAAAMVEENARNAAWGYPSGYDEYGGSTTLGWKETGTGYYRVVKRDGFWWLITPSGNPCFYRGVTTAPGLSWEMTPVTGRSNIFAELPPRSDPYSAGWAYDVWASGDGADYVAFHTANLIRKYKTGWDATATSVAIGRMKTWGFSGFSKWSSSTGRLPWIPVIYVRNVPKINRHPDVFDSTIRARIRESLASQMAGLTAQPWIVGWSVGSEWDEIVTTDETLAILQLGASVPAKRALIDHALQTMYNGNVAVMAAAWKVPAQTVQDLYASKPASPPTNDVEALRQHYADAYYSCIYQAVKSIDPNHLYLGNWIVPGWWQNENDWKLIARHCDVIGYDNYAFSFTTFQLARLMRETDKPVFCGEFSFPPTYRMQRGFGVYPNVYAYDDVSAGESYKQWIADASANPYCVGVSWFEYRDQMITGRGPGNGPDLVYGENYAFGLVDITDTPKWDMIARMREANLGAASARQSAMQTRPRLAFTIRALRSASGLAVVTDQDIHDLDMDVSGVSAGRIDLHDATALAARGL